MVHVSLEHSEKIVSYIRSYSHTTLVVFQTRYLRYLRALGLT